MRTHSFSFVALACTLLLAAAAPARASTGEPTVSLAIDDNAGVAAAADPNVDRGFLLPTAMTQPSGSLTYNNYELLLHGLTYGLTDRLQVSATVLAPIVKDLPFVGNLALKGRAFSVGRLHLALQGTGGLGARIGKGDGTVGFVGAGPLASYCLRADCSSLLNVSASYQLMFADGDPAHVVIYGGSLIHRVGEHVKLMLEVVSAAGGQDDLDQAPAVLLNYGVRFHFNKIAADVGFLRPIDDGGASDTFVMGLPFANVSYRW